MKLVLMSAHHLCKNACEGTVYSDDQFGGCSYLSAELGCHQAKENKANKEHFYSAQAMR